MIEFLSIKYGYRRHLDSFPSLTVALDPTLKYGGHVLAVEQQGHTGFPREARLACAS